jgi:hypothetical protein
LNHDPISALQRAKDYKHEPPVSGFCSLFETGSPYIAQAGLELGVLLLQPVKYWDYRLASSIHTWLVFFT